MKDYNGPSKETLQICPKIYQKGMKYCVIYGGRFRNVYQEKLFNSQTIPGNKCVVFQRTFSLINLTPLGSRSTEQSISICSRTQLIHLFIVSDIV